jgi:hypothetical protein
MTDVSGATDAAQFTLLVACLLLAKAGLASCPVPLGKAAAAATIISFLLLTGFFCFVRNPT